MAIAWSGIQNALLTWFTAASGLGAGAVIFANQHGPQPAANYGTILLRPARIVGGGPDELRWSTALQWIASTSYTVGTRVLNSVNLYACATAGVSAGSGGPSGAGAAIADGTVVWSFVSASAGAELLPTVVGQREFVVSFEVFAGAVTGGLTAAEYLGNAEASFALPSTRAAFAAVTPPFCFIDCGQAQDLSAIVSTNFQSRAAMDVRFRAVDSLSDTPIGYINTVVAAPTYSL